MYIIDKNKDFYDYLSHIYGVDKVITFDRRGSVIIDDEIIANYSQKHCPSFREKDENFVILEVGMIQYLIKVFNFKTKEIFNIAEFVSCSMEIVKIFNDNKHRFNTPISIRGVNLNYKIRWLKRKK